MSSSGTGLSRLLLLGYGIAFFGFLYLPLAVIVLFSFDASSVSSFPLEGWTLHWYRELFSDGALLGALWNSLRVAVVATAGAVLLGTSGALGLDRCRFPGRGLLQRLVLMPIVLPGILTGVSFLTFFASLNWPLSLTTVTLCHVTFCVPIVLTQVLARLRRFDRRLEDAAMDLYANRLKTLLYVTLPSLRTSILGGALLAFTLSMDEIVVTLFVTGRDNTLPMQVWAMLRRGITPEVNAIATLVLVASSLLVALAAGRLRTDN
ncbi:MAG: ABC transporter permease [Acidobacteriota bacterium]|nr:ABC transporter permease [Acidobacteriota bacterium]